MNPRNSDNTFTSSLKTADVGRAIDELMRNVMAIRRPFERRWYDNEFFDDGFHYKFISRSTGKMIDLSENGNIFNPFRSIPKASKQIRGIINTLLQNEYKPIIYPKRVISENYDTPEEFEAAKNIAKDEAKKIGLWLECAWKDQEMKQLVAQLLLIAAKQSTAWLKIWPAKEEQSVKVEIIDDFDMYVEGQKHNRGDLPFMIECKSKTIMELWANQEFNEEQKLKLTPDNKYSASQIKEAYMRSKYGLNVPSDFTKTVLLKEAYLMEYLNDDNMLKIRAQKDGDKILEGRKKGDKVLRQVFVGGTVWLKDTYLSLRDYPYIPIQFEPGSFYQTPAFERFVHANKILDTMVSRVERYTNTMVAGAWQRRKGENHTPTNLAGGIVYEYEQSPLTQLQIAPIPNYVFNFINLLNSFIAEQGMMMGGGQMPSGVTSAQAIEAIKAAEINQLKVTEDQIKLFITRWAETMVALAHDYFIKPQDVSMLEKGYPTYFEVVGQNAYEKMQELGMDTTGLTPINKELTVEVNAESGLGYTPEAKKAAALQLANFMQAMTQDGVISPQIMQRFVINLLEAYNFGSTQEFMELIESQNLNQVSPAMLDQIKLAVAQVFHDITMGAQGQPPAGTAQGTDSPPSPGGNPAGGGSGIERVPNTPPAAQQANPNVMNNPMAMGSQGGVPNAGVQ